MEADSRATHLNANGERQGWSRGDDPSDEQSRAEIEALFRRHERQLGRFLAQVVNDRWLADDLLQETFFTVVRERRRLASVDNVEAWLFAIARNRALHALRTRRRAWNALQRLARERPQSTPDPADAVAVRDYLTRHLTAEERALLVLRYLHGFDSAQLAEIDGRSPEAVRQQLSRVRRKLLRGLERPAEGPAPGSDRERL